MVDRARVSRVVPAGCVACQAPGPIGVSVLVVRQDGGSRKPACKCLDRLVNRWLPSQPEQKRLVGGGAISASRSSTTGFSQPEQKRLVGGGLR